MDEIIKISDAPSETEFSSIGDKIVHYASSIQITESNEFVRAAELRRMACNIARNVEEFFKPLKTAAYQSHKAITKREADILSRITEGIDILDCKIVEYKNESELPVPDVDKISYRETVDVVIEDMYDLIAWAAQDRSRVDYLLPNVKALRELAHASDKYYAVPGTRRTTKTSLVQGR